MIKRALIIPDCHIPYHCQKSWDLMMAVGKDIDPMEIVILGDFADFFGLSSHGKDAGISELFEEELFEVIEKLKEIKRTFPKAKIIFCEGNHEFRLPRYLNKNCPELYKSITVRKLLMLDHMGIEFIPYGPKQQYNILGSGLLAKHTPLAGGKNMAQSTVEKAMASVVFGHVHKLQEGGTVTIDGISHRGISSGWLGDKSHPVYKYCANHHQWDLGFTEMVLDNDGTWFTNLIHIKNNKCHYNGNIYYH